MGILQSVRVIRRHGGATALLGFLLLLGFVLHCVAASKIQILAGLNFPGWEPRLPRNMAGIEFFQGNPWFALPYLAFFLGTLIYAEARAIPRWALWSAFWALALPLAGYMWTCWRVAVCCVTSLMSGPGL